ncbi:MAG: alpha/beta fold hydrolase [Candidatus Poribacteria bacterium]
MAISIFVTIIAFNGVNSAQLTAEEGKTPANSKIYQLKSEVLEKYVTVDGIKIHYLTAGSGPPVILIHGLGVFAETWLYNIKPLSGRNTVYAPDLVGFGRSEKPKVKYSLAYFVKFLSGFMDALNIERASLVGNSMGGLIALRFALDYPNRVCKLVFVSGAGLGRKVSFGLRLLSLPILGDILLARTTKKGIRRGLEGSFYNPDFVTDEWVEETFKVYKLPSARRAFLSVLRSGVSIFGLKRDVVLLEQLPKIQAPTLIIWGKRDKVIPVEYAYTAHARIRDSQLHIFSECGHAPQVEKAKEFNRLVLEFLEK